MIADRELGAERAPTSDELVAGHLGLARSLANRFADRGEPLDDLHQVAFLGLVKAARRFDHSRGLQFSTYATATVLGELKRHFRDTRWAMHVPRPMQERFLRVRAAVDELGHELGRPPTIAEIARHVAITEEQVIESLDLSSTFRMASIDAPSGDDLSEPLSAVVASGDDDFVQVDASDRVREILSTLPPREREVVRLRVFEELTQTEIAKRVGVSQMHVSRLLSRSLGRLRSQVAS